MLSKLQIENWALRVIDRVESGQPHEDFLVELKREFLDPDRAARRIAGHANAARGENILWLIGVDEQSKSVIGVDYADLANWYTSVKSRFNEMSPALTDLNIPIHNKTVVALLFETDRIPFVVKNSAGGIQYETPWREGTTTRSATRSELIKLLAPLQRLPNLQVVKGELSCSQRQNQNVKYWQLSLSLYVSPRSDAKLVIPFHQCNVLLEVPEVLPLTTMEVDSLRPDGHEVQLPSSTFSPYTKLTFQSLSSTIDWTPTEVVINGAGMLYLKANFQMQPSEGDFQKDANVDISFRPVDAEQAASLIISMTRSSKGRTNPFNLNQDADEELHWIFEGT
jgi:hypothetical protein